MSQTSESHIYTGPWINWSHGPVVGSTITLSDRNGGLLTAFLAIFVSAAGGACWRIMSYALHQRRAKQDYQDGLHHQQQNIFRNTTTPVGAAWQMAQLAVYWREHTVRPMARTLPYVALAIVNMILFGVAGVFSSEVTKAAGNETLVRSADCGQVDLVSSLNSGSISEKDIQAALTAIDSNDTLAASTYSRACYGNVGNILQCSQYAQRQIPWTVNQNATCPFANDLCYFGASAAYEMDTGLIDSHIALGINAPQQDRVQYRKVTTCAPIHQKGYVVETNVTNQTLHIYGDTLDQFFYGETLPDQNYTYSYNEHSIYENYGYFLNPIVAYAEAVANAWTPIPALNRTDADVSLYFLAPNSVQYEAPVEDPFFSAHIPLSISSQGGSGSTNLTYYLADQYINVLGCADQHQYCNPTNQKCTSLTGQAPILRELDALDLNYQQGNTTIRLGYLLQNMNTYWSVHSRGANALLASETVSGTDSQQVALPSNQWHIEVNNWFAVSMAKLQQRVVTYATGPSYIPKGAVLLKPSNVAQTKMCGQQKIRSSNGTISFSVLGVAIILIIGSILILTNLVLDIAMGFLRRKLHWKDYKRLQWDLDEKLQLQRLAYEEAGQGHWSGGLDVVPVTRKGDVLGLPEEADPLHPRFGRRGLNYADGTAESEQLMMEKGMGYRAEPMLVEPYAG